MAMRPNTSWIQRVDAVAGVATDCEIALIFFGSLSLTARLHMIERSKARCGPGKSRKRCY
jgi:hypothetical protein